MCLNITHDFTSWIKGIQSPWDCWLDKFHSSNKLISHLCLKHASNGSKHHFIRWIANIHTPTQKRSQSMQLRCVFQVKLFSKTCTNFWFPRSFEWTFQINQVEVSWFVIVLKKFPKFCRITYTLYIYLFFFGGEYILFFSFCNEFI